ncbi:MAG: DJ-1 family glyoxalase III [Acutalibacteraceae bacterium]
MIYCFLATGFEETEAIAPIDILRRGNLEIKTVGVGSKVIVGSHGIPIVADITEDEIDFENIDCIMLPGGMPGTVNLEKDKTVNKALEFAYENGKYIGAICAAPYILGKKGYLKGKKATCFPEFSKDLIGAEYTGNLAEKDGKIITGKGAGAATKYGLMLLEAIKGREIAEEVRGAMQCK